MMLNEIAATTFSVRIFCVSFRFISLDVKKHTLLKDVLGGLQEVSGKLGMNDLPFGVVRVSRFA